MQTRRGLHLVTSDLKLFSYVEGNTYVLFISVGDSHKHTPNISLRLLTFCLKSNNIYIEILKKIEFIPQEAN